MKRNEKSTKHKILLFDNFLHEKAKMGEKDLLTALNDFRTYSAICEWVKKKEIIKN